jgi:hypothetical protein
LTAREVTKAILSRTRLEGRSIESDRLVGEKVSSSGVFPSRARLVEPGLKLGGPPPKAKYYLATDSAKVG